MYLCLAYGYDERGKKNYQMHRIIFFMLFHAKRLEKQKQRSPTFHHKLLAFYQFTPILIK